ncbi:MAG: hypothetical protein JXA71_02255, partial [Chitinispirillaceae bacterium]|nr:hypothetical protein [Chitinispirillaceae bacterium]
MITANGTYPAGSPLTIKVVPNAGQVFTRWQDAAGKSITAQTQFLNTMGAAAVSFFAMYQGGTAVTGDNPGAGSMQLTENLSFVRAADGSISLQAQEPILLVRMTDLAGRIVFRTLLTHRLCEHTGADGWRQTAHNLKKVKR